MKSSNLYGGRTNPLPISELLNSESSFTSIIPTFEEPMNYHSHIQKLINRTKNVEAEMVRNYNHGQVIFNEFFRLLETTEMVAFDFMYIDCLMNVIQFNDFWEFIKKCSESVPSFDYPTEQDVKKAADHIRYLHSVIHTCCNDFQNFDPRSRIEPPQRPHKIYEYIDGLKKELEVDIRKSELKKYEPPEVEYNYGVDPSQNLSTPPSNNTQQFNDWLSNYIQPDHDSNQNLAPHRSLLGNIFHKMNAIQRLQKEIKEIKKDTMQSKYMSALDLDTESIQNSPYYKAALGNTAFLRLSINNFLSEKTKIDSCENYIENILVPFAKLHDKCHETLQSAKKIQVKVQESIADKHNQLKNLNSNLMAYYDLFINEPKIERIYQLLDDIINLEKEFTSLCKAELERQQSLNHEEEARNLSTLLTVLQELISLENRPVLFDACRECAKERKDEPKMHKRLFSLTSDLIVPKEKQHFYEKIQGVFSQYKSELDNVFKIFNKSQIPIENWCKDVNSSLNEMEAAIEEHEKLIKIGNGESNEDDSIENDSGDTDDEIQSLNLEIQQLEKELAEANSQKNRLQEEIDHKNEELFDQIQMNDMYIIYQGSNLEKTRKLKEYKEAVICSVCKKNLCDVVINKKNCCHPFCRQCVDKDGSCPICGTHYTTDALLEFTFNPKNI